MINLTRLAAIAPLALLMVAAGCSDNNELENMLVAPPTGGDTGGGMVDVTPCLEQEIPGTGVTVAEAVVPDTLTIDYLSPSGFPNGRGLSDPVIDVTLAVIFLDLSVNGPGTFAGLPLNPSANDVAFNDNFPFLAAAQGTPPMSSSAGTAFTFDMSADANYVRVDRMGMPAVSTALIPTDGKIPYNDGSPSDDVDGMFVGYIVEVLTGLTEALADDLSAAGLTACAAVS